MVAHLTHCKQYLYDSLILLSAGVPLFINETKEALALATAGVVFLTACIRFYKEFKNKNKNS